MGGTTHAPQVSLGLPVRNGERFLARAIDSCRAQTFEDFELIISDNGSIDGTAEICHEYERTDSRIRYLRGRSVSAWRNYNRVFELSTGEYFKWIAHDDCMDPPFLRAAIEDLRAHPEAALTTSRLRYVGDEGEHKGIRPRLTDDVSGAASPDLRTRLRSVLRFRDVSASVFGLIRSSALLRTGWIRNVPEPDRVLVGELALLGPIRFLDEPLYTRYRGYTQASRDSWTWLDPENEKRLKLATPRFLYHHLAAIRRSDLGTSEKLALASELAMGSAFTRTRYRFRRLDPAYHRRRRESG